MPFVVAILLGVLLGVGGAHVFIQGRVRWGGDGKRRLNLDDVRNRDTQTQQKI